MSKYRLIALDLDDTLLDSQLRISSRNLEAVRRAQQKGIHVTLATGRMFCSALPYAKQLDIDLPLITYQGALIKTALSEEVFLHRAVPLDLAQQVITTVKEFDYHINLYVDDQLFVEKLTPEGKTYARNCRIGINPVGDLLNFLQVSPTKIVVINHESKLDVLQREVEPIFGSKLHITKSKPHLLEFSHPEATKGHALDMLAKHYGVTRQQVMALGDSYNDLEMLDYAGFAVVMDNARDEIKSYADFVAPTNDQDGVAEVLEQFVL